MQHQQISTHPNVARTTFLPMCPPCSCPTASPLSRRSLTPLRPQNSCCRWQAVPRRKRIRITAEQSKTPSDSSSDETNKENASDSFHSAQHDDDDDDFQISLPNAFEVNGEPGCLQCSGKGEIDCPVCDGSGFFTLNIMDTVSSSQCRMCMGQRIIPCPTCREIVFKSVLWWDKIPSAEEDPEEKWRDGPDGPRFSWGENPAGS